MTFVLRWLRWSESPSPSALSQPTLSESQQESARQLAAQSQRLASLVENLLEMARIQTGETTLRRRWHPIEEVIGSAIKSARPALGERPVEVTIAQ